MQSRGLTDIYVAKIGSLSDVHDSRPQSNSSISFYPNPANTEITLSNDGCESCSVVIYNVEGKQVYVKTNVSDKFKINVSEFNRGLYLIKLVDKENKSFSKRLVID